jgi:metallophosphoesterase superfamily enzyme
VIILGDIAYDLDGNNGTKYENFLQELSSTLPAIPIIFVTGNHEHHTADTVLLAT